MNHKLFFFRASNDIVRANGRHLIGLGAVLSAPGDQLCHGSHLRLQYVGAAMQPMLGDLLVMTIKGLLMVLHMP